jgi:hypothetical protein
MNDVTVVAKPALAGKRLAFALAEDRVGHYAEFRAFFVSEAGFLRAPSGMVYALVFTGRSGEPFPSGVELYAIVDALEPVTDDMLDTDLWAILGWMIDGVGPPWTRRDLEETGRLYRIPPAAR